MRLRVLPLAALPLAVCLSGCFSNEPDANDILQAARANANLRRLIMMDKPGINIRDMASVDAAAVRALNDGKVEKLGCTQPPPGMAGLLCEFRIGVNVGGQLRFEKYTQRFLKVNGNWQIVA